MAITDALAFIRAAHDDAQLAAQVDELEDSATLNDVVALASRAGFVFSADDLRLAHKHDWGLRLARFGGAGTQTNS